VINVTNNITMSNQASPDEVANQVGRVTGNRVAGALYDGVNES
jgi:hypothetical protein